MNKTVNIIGRIDPAKKDTIGAKEFTEQIKEQMDKYAGINVDDKVDGQHAICDLQYVLGYNGTMKTDCKGMTTTTNPLKKTMKYVEKINENNIGDKLHEMLTDLDNNMKFAGQYFIVAHLPYDDSKNIKDGRMILAKFGNTGDKPESFTIYKKVNSQNHIITLGEPDEFTLDIDDEYIQKNTTWADSAETGRDDILKTFPEEPEIKGENPMRENKAAAERERKAAAAADKERKAAEKEMKIAADRERKAAVAAENARQMEAEKVRLKEAVAAENARQMEAEKVRLKEAAAQKEAAAEERERKAAEEKVRKAAEEKEREAAVAAEKKRKAAKEAVAPVAGVAPAAGVAAAAARASDGRNRKTVIGTNRQIKGPTLGIQSAQEDAGRELRTLYNNKSIGNNVKEKEEFIKQINDQIAKYNTNSSGRTLEILDVKKYSQEDIASIQAFVPNIINAMDNRRIRRRGGGGKPTRRRRHKMNPTQKKTHKKPKTKKKSNKGVIKRRKTRSKK